MTKLGFFELKATLTEMYWKGIAARDGFHFESDEGTDFQYRFYRDMTWTYHVIGRWDAVLGAAREYQERMVEKIDRTGNKKESGTGN